MTKLNLIGEKFTYLLVLNEALSYIRNGKQKYRWECQCDCGKITTTTTEHLRSGHTKSCGCYGKHQRTTAVTKHGNARVKNKSPEYRCWEDIKKRCYNPNAQNFKYYGAKGITVCDRWKDSFENFLSDMGKKPSGYEIDRVNNYKGYQPDNCHWVTTQQNKRNMSNNRNITIDGVTRCVADWCDVFKINKHTVYQRIHRKWPQDRWFTTTK